jgi:hypothetical protein
MGTRKRSEPDKNYTVWSRLSGWTGSNLVNPENLVNPVQFPSRLVAGLPPPPLPTSARAELWRGFRPRHLPRPEVLQSLLPAPEARRSSPPKQNATSWHGWLLHPCAPSCDAVSERATPPPTARSPISSPRAGGAQVLSRGWSEAEPPDPAPNLAPQRGAGGLPTTDQRLRPHNIRNQRLHHPARAPDTPETKSRVTNRRPESMRKRAKPTSSDHSQTTGRYHRA